MNGKNIIIPKREFIIGKNCRICKSRQLYKFFSLGLTPLANAFLNKKDLDKPEKYYPLNVYFCKKCYLVQLLDIVNPKILFKDYAYMTGASSPMKRHFYDLAKDISKKFTFSKHRLIIDIGSNDGTLLSNFKKLKFQILGIEPARNLALLARKRGIPTINMLFNEEVARKISKKFNKASIIIATNVFAHVNNLDDFVRGIKNLLADDGIFIIEVPYLLSLLKNLEFDTIYHEHLSYFSIHSLVYLFRNFGLQIIEIENISVHGGSIRIFIQKQKQKQKMNISKKLKAYLWQEKKAGLLYLSTYKNFTKRVLILKQQLLVLLSLLKQQGNSICGYGATAKGNTLLNFCGINHNLIDFIIDTTPFKEGKFTPGTHIPIFPRERMYKKMPDYTLLLAWNYAKDILIKEKKYRENEGKFILPISIPKIV